MFFVDEVTAEFHAGRGGDGCVSLHREAFIAKGGPSGGSGGRGGDIILLADPNVNTLSEFRYKKKVKALGGTPGGTQDKTGANAPDTVIHLPVGTLLKNSETGELVYDLSTPHQRIQLCRGGRGGKGNAHFASATRQTPRFAELGDRGEFIKVHLELKLVADIGIIGMPSAGKSTLIASITNAKPKIAEYHFTTLIPNLGIMEHKDRTLVIEDVPGLIPGAHTGQGLGIQFLKHIQRTKALVHLLDASHYDDCLKNYEAIRNELELFDPELSKKEEIIILSKTDIVGDDEIIEEVRKTIQEKYLKIEVLTISAATHQGIEELKDTLITRFSNELQKIEEVKTSSNDMPLIQLGVRKRPNEFKVIQSEDEEYTYYVSGERINQIVRMTEMMNREGVMRVYDVCKKMGILENIGKKAAKQHKEKYPEADYVNEENVFQIMKDGKIVIEETSFPFDKMIFL